MADRLHLYRSYNFVDKDPVIDGIRSVIQGERLKFSQVAGLSGVSRSTIDNWLNGQTRRPQWSSIAAVATGLGYTTVHIKNGGVRFDKEKDINYPRELDKIAKEIIDERRRPRARKRVKPARRNGHGEVRPLALH